MAEGYDVRTGKKTTGSTGRTLDPDGTMAVAEGMKGDLGEIARRNKAAAGSAASGPKSPLAEASERAKKAADALAAKSKRSY